MNKILEMLDFFYANKHMYERLKKRDEKLMRNPNRIKPYCDTLASVWGMVPDWRLGQLMKNALNEWVNQYGTDPFYAEDEEFLNFLFEYITKLTK